MQGSSGHVMALYIYAQLNVSSHHFVVIVTKRWACDSSFADILPPATVPSKSPFAHRSRTAVGVPLTLRSANAHVIVTESSPVLSKIAAIEPSDSGLVQHEAVVGSASCELIGTPWMPSLS